MLGLPFTWKKFRGGVELTWVRFEIVLKGAKLGLSSSRAQWLVKWLRTTADLGQAKIADVSSVLGRLSFGLTALGHYRPFLGPVYAWVAATQNFSVCRLPKAIQLIFRFLAKVLDGDGRLLAVGSAKQQEVELFRTDAKAEGNTVRIAGWACCDSADTWQRRWFSETLDHTNAPWLFCSGESYRQIASLELAATLVAGFYLECLKQMCLPVLRSNRQQRKQQCGGKMVDNQVPTIGFLDGAGDTAAKQRGRLASALAASPTEHRGRCSDKQQFCRFFSREENEV